MNRNHVAIAAIIAVIMATILYFHYGKTDDASMPERDHAAYIGTNGEGEKPPPTIKFHINMNQILHDESTHSSMVDTSAPTSNREYLWPVIALALLNIVFIVILIRHIRKKGGQ